jgi:hypothetical protein
MGASSAGDTVRQHFEDRHATHAPLYTPLTHLSPPPLRPEYAEHKAIIEEPIPASELFEVLSPVRPSLDGVDIVISESRRLHLTPHNIHPNNETDESTVNESVGHENKTVKGIVWAI